MAQPDLLIGIVGSTGAGKDKITNRLVDSSNFFHASLSDKLKGSSLAQEIDPFSGKLRPYREVGRQLRIRYGADVLVRDCLKDWEAQYNQLGDEARMNCVISGHMTPEEADAVRLLGGAIIWLQAPAEVRYWRRLARDVGTVKDEAYDEFMRQDKIGRLGLAGPYTPYDDQPILWPGDKVIDASRPLAAVYEDLDAIVAELSPLDQAAAREERRSTRSHQDIAVDGYLRYRYAQTQLGP